MTIAPRAKILEKIGFFYFVEEYYNPVLALAKAIEKEQEMRNLFLVSLSGDPPEFRKTLR
jgi:hypothetical protein